MTHAFVCFILIFHLNILQSLSSFSRFVRVFFHLMECFTQYDLQWTYAFPIKNLCLREISKVNQDAEENFKL